LLINPVFGAPGEVSAASNAPTFPHYQLFDEVLTTLIEDFWRPNGNWAGDMMGDATAFAPAVLLNWGTETSDPDLIYKAWKTVEWEDRLFEKWIIDSLQNQFSRAEFLQTLQELLLFAFFRIDRCIL
jgi:hypothetical protein